MWKLIPAAMSLALGGAAVAQATPPTLPSPAASAASADSSAPLRRCSATVRDRCLQDERFSRDAARPGGSRDNNAINYPTSADAERKAPRR